MTHISLSKITAIFAVAVVLTGCLGGDSDSTDSSSTYSTNENGTLYTAVKGEVSGAEAICYDSNAIEIDRTITGDDGTFRLACPEDGSIEISGGLDVTTGEPVSGLVADADALFITPVTSLLRLVKRGEVDESTVDLALLEKAKSTHPLQEDTEDSRKIAKLAVVLNSYALQVVEGTKNSASNKKDYGQAIKWLAQGQSAGKKITDWADDSTADDGTLDTLHTKMQDDLGVTLSDDMKTLLKEMRKKPAKDVRDSDKVKDGIKGLVEKIKGDKGLSADFSAMFKPAPSARDVKVIFNKDENTVRFFLKAGLKKKIKSIEDAGNVVSYTCKFVIADVNLSKENIIAGLDFTTETVDCSPRTSLDTTAFASHFLVVQVTGVLDNPIVGLGHPSFQSKDTVPSVDEVVAQ